MHDIGPRGGFNGHPTIRIAIDERLYPRAVVAEQKRLLHALPIEPCTGSQCKQRRILRRLARSSGSWTAVAGACPQRSCAARIDLEARMKRQQLTLCLGITLLLVLTGCFAVQQQRLHPPTWIHGEWGMVSDPEAFSLTFTATTVIQRSGNVSLDLGELYRVSETVVTETVTDTLYSFTVPTETGYSLRLAVSRHLERPSGSIAET